MFEGWRSRSRAGLVTLVAACAFAAGPVSNASAVDPWVASSLDHQYALANDVPFVNAPFLGTHNSFNSIAEMGLALSTLDSNQKVKIVDQLELGIRNIELDLHWMTPDRAGPARRGRLPWPPPSEINLGCTVEKKLAPVLDPIAAWLDRPANSQEVIVLYVQDELDNLLAHNSAASIFAERLGNRVYQPPGGGCTELPIGTLTREAVLASGAQVVIAGSCGVGSSWQDQVFGWSDRLESRPVGFQDYPNCGPDFSRAQYDTRLVRYFQDTTLVTNGIPPLLPGLGTRDDGLTPANTAAMMRCGVDLTGFDQLTQTDARPHGGCLELGTRPAKRRRQLCGPDERSNSRGCPLVRAGLRPGVSSCLPHSKHLAAWIQPGRRRLRGC